MVILNRQGSGPAVFSVNKVYSYETRFFSLNEIKKTYQKQLCIHDDWWERKQERRICHFAGNQGDSRAEANQSVFIQKQTPTEPSR